MLKEKEMEINCTRGKEEEEDEKNVRKQKKKNVEEEDKKRRGKVLERGRGKRRKISWK